LTASANQRGVDTTVGQPGFCEQCGHHMGDGPDVCLGLIPGVSHACCGHGDKTKAYAVLGGAPDVPAYLLADLVTLRGQDAVTFFDIVRRARVAEQGEFPTTGAAKKPNTRPRSSGQNTASPRRKRRFNMNLPSPSAEPPSLPRSKTGTQRR
jgi:hypothetical protein